MLVWSNLKGIGRCQASDTPRSRRFGSCLRPSAQGVEEGERASETHACRRDAGQGAVEGGVRKVVSLGHKRQVAQSLVEQGRCTARTVCRHFGIHHSTFKYQANEPDSWLPKLKTALRRMSRARPELGLAVPSKKRKVRRRGVSTGLPMKATQRGHVWTWDFVNDTTVRGGKVRRP